MPELTQILQKQLDASQHCPLCQAAMYWIEGEYYQKTIHFHQCSHCEHCIYYGEQAQNCHCPACQKARKKQIVNTRFAEQKQDRKKKRQQQDNVEYLLDELSLLDKLFLLSLLDGSVDEQRPHDEYIHFEHYYPLQIAPSYQLFKAQKQHFIQSDYLVAQQQDGENYFTNIKLHGYRDPSLLALTQQLRAWFYQDFSQGVPYRDSEEVKRTLVTLLAHEILNFCQYCCQKWHVQFYGNQQFIDYCKSLLNDLAVTQIFFLIDKALNYLQQNKLLETSNQNFINTHRLRKTLIQYRGRGQQQHWETANLERPQDLIYSQMSYIFIHRFLKFEEKAFQQPLWKCWQDILPRLRFFSEQHCIHCGSKDIIVEYNTAEYVSFRCQQCKQQEHYFIG